MGRGTIPNNFGDIYTSLQSILLWQNKFTSTIPSNLGNIKSLEMLQLPYNNIMGSMPDDICMLRKDYNLNILSSDCSDDIVTGGGPKVICDCCTTCYSGY